MGYCLVGNIVDLWQLLESHSMGYDPKAPRLGPKEAPKAVATQEFPIPVAKWMSWALIFHSQVY